MSTSPRALSRTASLVALCLFVGACDSGLDPTPDDGSPPGLDVTEPFPIDRGDEGIQTPGKYKGLWLRLVDNGSPTVTPFEGRIGVICIGMTDTAVECADYIARINSHWLGDVAGDVAIMNCGRPGAGVEDWLDPANDHDLWGACLNVLLPYVGVSRNQIRVVYHTAGNRHTTREDGSPLPTYPSAGSNYDALYANLDAFASRVLEFFPNLQAVYTSSRNYGGFGKGPGRGEPLVYEEGHAVNSWLSAHPAVEGVWHGWGAYVWAPPCPAGTPNGGGVCYSQGDFEEDGLTAAPSGRAKISWLIHHRLLEEAWYRRF